MTSKYPTLWPDVHRKKRTVAQRRHAARLRAARRASIQEVLHRAQLLPQKPRALVRAFYELHITAEELALPCGIQPQQMRRRIARLRHTLADPDFLLAARFGPQLSKPFDALAADHWVEGRSLRELAADRGVTLAHIRSQLAQTRLLLVKASIKESLNLEREVA